MCGIAGIFGTETVPPDTLSRMLDTLKHRGPDDAGIWSEGNLALGHRRLSIVDLSPAGHQPMLANDGNLVLVYNGEIYNCPELRMEIGGSSHTNLWRGHSDTEVLLACLAQWGVRQTLERANGMFAFALWDKRNKTLTLARDRMGEKPLYFGWPNGRFAFASELKALREIAGWIPRMNQAAVSSFLEVGYVRGPQSAIEGLYRLPPGSLLTLGVHDLKRPYTWEELTPRLVRYWTLQRIASDTHPHDAYTEEELVDELDELLNDSVKRRMVADVPIGAFLSGGIDSSLITAIMQKQSSQPIHTFSIGFDHHHYDEAAHARAVASHIGTEHHELYLKSGDVLNLVPNLALTFDEPFADSSQLPTMLVSRLARESVTVALSGDGGDELFAGYGRYMSILRVWKWLSHIPAAPRHTSMQLMSALINISGKLIPGQPPLLQKLDRFGERIKSPDIEDLRISFIAGAGVKRLQKPQLLKKYRSAQQAPAQLDPLRHLLFADQVDYLPDDILHKVDRASMAYSLETRIPFLDHRMVELSWRMPGSMLMSRREGKLPLRKLLDRHVPTRLVDRPKQGFAPPISEWLREPLRDWAEALLSPYSLQQLPMLNERAVRKLWLQHLNSQIDAGQTLWNVIMLSNWRTQFKIGC